MLTLTISLSEPAWRTVVLVSSFDGHILTGTTVPTEPTTGLDAVPLLAPPIEWVNIEDENNEVWKLYPDVHRARPMY